MNKVLSCFLCFAPIVLLVMYVGLLLFYMMFAMGGAPTGLVMGILIGIMILIVLYIVALYGVMIWLSVRTCKSSTIEGGMKAAWVVMFIFVNVLIYPVYWFVQIRQE